jgi:hypothetical protein
MIIVLLEYLIHQQYVDLDKSCFFLDYYIKDTIDGIDIYCIFQAAMRYPVPFPGVQPQPGPPPTSNVALESETSPSHSQTDVNESKDTSTDRPNNYQPPKPPPNVYNNRFQPQPRGPRDQSTFQSRMVCHFVISHL